MQEKLVPLIDEIIKFGMSSDFNSKKYIFELEKAITKLYLFYLSNEFLCDDVEYPDFEKQKFSFVEYNVTHNFPTFGNYKYFNDSSNLDEKFDILYGNSANDLVDIIFDLLEVKFTFENYGDIAGQNIFDVVFGLNTKLKILNLINYIYFHK